MKDNHTLLDLIFWNKKATHMQDHGQAPLVGWTKNSNLLTHQIQKDFEATNLLQYPPMLDHVVVYDSVPISTMKQIEGKPSQDKIQSIFFYTYKNFIND